MGDAVVSGLVTDVLGRLTSVALQEFGLLWEFKNNILTLKDDFSEIQAVLEDAEGKRTKQKEVDLWLKRVRLASLEVENVLDDVSTEALLQRLHKKRGIIYWLRAFFSSNHNLLMFRVRTTHKIKALRKKLDAIKSKRSELGLTPSAISLVDVGVKDEMPDRETSYQIHSSVIFGRNEETEMVAHTICNKDIGKFDYGEIRVYGIWGMGGVGKTTLAQLVYNHERVNQYFELKCWVYVSEKFQVKEITKKIIEFIDKCGCTLTELSTLQDSLQSKLRGKKFLIVLDDVWIEEDQKAKWEELSRTLSCGAERSTVVMTTRSWTTSRMMAKVRELQHELGCLSAEDSWLLFKKFPFVEGREGDRTSELEHIGREIVEKCKGLPLAVKTLGSLMWSKKSTRDWEHVKGSIVWNLEEGNVLPALKLSYDYLLPHLKRCFSYCCLFPKGHELEKNVLIPLWLSNGFIPPREEISPYYVGEEIFNCLVWRSFFQVVEAKKYKMHDLMHDMARHVMRDDCLVIEPGKDIKIPNEELHLTSSCTNFLFSPQELRKLTSLRSILILVEMDTYNSQFFNHYMYIRVLYFTGVKLKTFPTSICNLKHLRYLNLSKSYIEALPESIIFLQNLQVLILSSSIILCELPKGLRYMTNLQHLDISYCYFLVHLPSGIKKLTSLRILSKFPLGDKSGAKIGELRNLNLLEGKLAIEGLENVGGLSEAASANLKSKTYVSALKLRWTFKREWSYGGHREMFAYDEEVLMGLEPNLCLEVLTIFDYMGKTISPSWMPKLINLVKITLWDCMNCLCVPALGRLPNLKVIKMRRMKSLKCLHDDDMSGDITKAFLSLQKLYIDECSILVSLPSNLPKLEVLNIVHCEKLVSLPSNIPNIKRMCLERCDSLLSLPDEIQTFKNLNELMIWYCNHLFERYDERIGQDWHKISHIPKVIIY